MRRLLAILLLTAFGLPVAAPAFALNTGSDANLPACCRRNGKHHCMMSQQQMQALMDGQHVTTVRSKCPCFPTAAIPLHHQNLATGTASPELTALVSLAEKVRQAETCARIALAGAQHKRGPPAVRLS